MLYYLYAEKNLSTQKSQKTAETRFYEQNEEQKRKRRFSEKKT